MKAWISHEPGGPETLVLDELPDPIPADDEVLVKIDAVGVNYPDGLLLRDLYQVKPPRPFVPGSEFCGVVEHAGAGVTRLRPGDLVIGRCGWGAMAERIAVTAQRCVRIAPETPRAQAAAFMFAYATAYHSLVDAAQLRAGQTVLVLGAAGGVGSAAVEVARALGARVLAAVSSDSKLAFALARGASAGIVYDAQVADKDAQQALARQLKEMAGGGCDVVVDPVGGLYTEPALRSLKRGGRHLVVGFTAGIPRVPLNLALLKSLQIIGVDWRSFVQDDPKLNDRNVQSLLAMWREGVLQPEVTETFTLAEAPAAIARLDSRSALGKIVVV
ncbi:NADPH:quinone oxidoreductase family protein, partial [Verticiella sediminum]